MRLDLHDNITVRQALNSATVSTSTTTVGATIDTSGYHSLEFVTTLGTRTDGTYTPLIEESDNSNMSSSNEVADENLFGTEAAAALTASNGISKIGVRLGKRYVRYSVVSTTVTSGSTGVHAIAILGTPDVAATS